MPVSLPSRRSRTATRCSISAVAAETVWPFSSQKWGARAGWRRQTVTPALSPKSELSTQTRSPTGDSRPSRSISPGHCRSLRPVSTLSSARTSQSAKQTTMILHQGCETVGRPQRIIRIHTPDRTGAGGRDRRQSGRIIFQPVTSRRDRPAPPDQRQAALSVRERSSVAREQPPQAERLELERRHRRGAD